MRDHSVGVNKKIGRPSPLAGPLLAFWGHVQAGNVLILDRENGQLVPLRPNWAQKRLWQRMVAQARAGKPIRIIIPKARKEGISTFIQALYEFLCELIPNQKAITYAQTDDDTATIFKIAQRIHYRGEPRARGKSATEIRFANGSEYVCRTFGGKGVSRGDTIAYMHISELAACQSISGADAKQITGLINAVPDAPHTIVIIESTGDGPFGEFYNRCCKAREAKGEYELLFFPWFADVGYRRPCPPGFKMTEEERDMASMYVLTKEQIYWYRCKIADQSNVQLAKREFPTTFDDCFAATSGRVYAHFSSAPLNQRGHMGSWKITADMERYRVIDWGSGGEHPFVCLWIAHDPDHNPALVVHPDCTHTRDEFLSYIWNNKAGLDQPLKTRDHAMDALRILVATKGLKGLVYVYRELYLVDEPPSLDRIAAMIHDMSGWVMPEGAPPAEISLYEPGPKGEQYRRGVADRAQPKNIEMFTKWGIPLQPHKAPSMVKGTSRGEVLDGIGQVSTLISGRTRFAPLVKDKHVEIHEKIANNAPRKTLLSVRDSRTLRDEREQLARDARRDQGDFDLTDEPMGYVGY